AALWLGRAIALEAAGEFAAARQIGEQLSAHMPTWLDAHRFLAELRLNTEPGAGQTGGYADHFAAAAAKVPQNTDLIVAWCAALGGADRFAEATRVAEEALLRRPDEPAIVLAAATYASAAGELDRADRHFASLGTVTLDRCIEEGRHRLRRGDPQAAEAMLSRALEQQPGHVLGWALRSIAWRQLDDPRERWLHGQEGLVRQLPLEIGDREWAEVGAVLHRLHDESFVPVGQSVRGGSQTRGRLFARTEPSLRRLEQAIAAAVEDYRRALPPFDPAHPLLARREDRLAITGSWSVRLGPGGSHTVHIHPKGVLSSALYLALPDGGEQEADIGVLEVGGAPKGIALQPSAAIAPRERHLTLFPSTLFHGTRPFARGQRLTVAFDVTARAH
ncbi:2OG-Fe(II) oxygenase family protein, partial [Novosphingobium sp. 1949]